jgi:sporulation protein YlmC with PRC-barrel domain
MQPVLVHDLVGRSVVTQDGAKLGTLKDVAIDIDSGRVVHYEVKPTGILSGPHLIISSDEIIEIQAEMIVVKNTAISVTSPVLA